MPNGNGGLFGRLTSKLPWGGGSKPSGGKQGVVPSLLSKGVSALSKNKGQKGTGSKSGWGWS